MRVFEFACRIASLLAFAVMIAVSTLDHVASPTHGYRRTLIPLSGLLVLGMGGWWFWRRRDEDRATDAEHAARNAVGDRGTVVIALASALGAYAVRSSRWAEIVTGMAIGAPSQTVSECRSGRRNLVAFGVMTVCGAYAIRNPVLMLSRHAGNFVDLGNAIIRWLPFPLGMIPVQLYFEYRRAWLRRVQA